jgi:hypothetical protein
MNLAQRPSLGEQQTLRGPASALSAMQPTLTLHMSHETPIEAPRPRGKHPKSREPYRSEYMVNDRLRLFFDGLELDSTSYSPSIISPVRIIGI